MCYNGTQSNSTAIRRIYKRNYDVKGNYSTKLPSREGDTLSTRVYIKSEGPLKGH